MRDVTDNIDVRPGEHKPGLVVPAKLYHGSIEIGTRIAGNTVITHRGYCQRTVPDTEHGKIRMRIFRK